MNRMNRTDRSLCMTYGVIALAALIGTWSQNLTFFAQPDNGGVPGFLRAAFANPAAASISIDILFFALAASVWMVVESRRLAIRGVWIYIVLSFVIAVSVMFPLFLIARQLRLAHLREA
jgi:hypothetical protein